MRHLIKAAAGALAVFLLGCSSRPSIPPTPTPTPRADATALPTLEAASPLPPTEGPTPTPFPPSGPTNFPPNVNPLTGEWVDDPAVLDHRPLIVKVNNNPPEVRPYQAGLQFADHVWEHQVEGFALTRFSAVIYGKSPERVGSVRSGRPPDLEMVPMYQAIYVASGFSTNLHNREEPPRMREYMLRASWWNRNFSPEFGWAEPYNIRVEQGDLAWEHTLFAVPEELWKLADEKNVNERPTLDGLAFDPNPPAGGSPTGELTIDYPGVGPLVSWKWDETRKKWLRWVDDEPHIEALNGGQQLTFDNVVVVYAPMYETDWPEDFATGALGVAVDLFGTDDAVLLRDGQRYELSWRRDGTQSDKMIQFVDAAGNVIAFHPGNTWFQLVSNWYAPPTVTFAP